MAVIPESQVNLQSNIGRILLDAGGIVDIDDALTYFKKDANINIFSRKKPVPRKGLYFQDFDPNDTTSYYPEWWKGVDGNCGLVFKNVSNLNDLPNIIDGYLNGWEYNIPQGEDADLRCSDFMGYDTDAKSFVEGFSLSRDIVDKSSNSSITASFIVTPEETRPTSLHFSDFTTNLANYYPGVFVKKKNVSNHFFMTANTKVGNGGSMVTIPTTGLSTGKWEAFMFLSEVNIPSMSTIGQVALGNCYTIPYTKKVDFEVVSSMVLIRPVVSRSTQENWIDIRVVILSYLSTRTFTNNYIYIRPLGKPITDVSTPYNKNIADPEFAPAVKGESTTVYSISIQVDRELYNNGCTCYVTVNRGDYDGKADMVSLPPTPTNE